MNAHLKQSERIQCFWSVNLRPCIGCLLRYQIALAIAMTTGIGLAACDNVKGVPDGSRDGQSGGNWAQYRGPYHDGTSRERIRLKSSAGPFPEIWKVKTKAGFSSFSIGDGKAFTIVTQKVNDVNHEVCIALDINNGKEFWHAAMAETNFDGGGNAGAPDNSGGDGPPTTPSYDSGYVYVLDNKLGLYCFDATNGQTVWSKDLVKEHDGTMISWGNAASPLVEGDHVFVAGGGPGQALLAFNKRTGAVVWKAQDDKLAHATPIAATIHGVRQIIFYTQSGLVSVVPETGEVLWRQPYPFNVSAAASPIVYEDIVYCSAGYGVGAGAFRVTQSGGKFTIETFWRKHNKLINHWSTPACKDGYLYGMYSFKNYDKGPLKCVDIRTGEVQWSVDGFGPGNCIIVGDHVVALSDQGEVVLIETTPTEYREVYRADVLDGKCWSMPSFTNGHLYIRSTMEGACLDFSGS